MAEIKPFKGLRYTAKAGEIGELVCPPYDIISDEQRNAFVKRNQYNVIRLELPTGDDPYQGAADTLDRWRQEEILKNDMDDGLYIYSMTFRSHVETGEEKTLTGLVCRVRVEPFEHGVVLPHEETLSKAKDDRFHLIRATECNFSQIYSLYPDAGHVTRDRLNNIALNTAPRYLYDDGLVTHRMWVINDPMTIDAICHDFKDRKLYIADGHHRYETALNFKRDCQERNHYLPGSDYVMMFLADMADEGLVVFPTHRIIRGLTGFSGDQLLERCKTYFIVESLNEMEIEDQLLQKAQNHQKAFVFMTKNSYQMLTLKDPKIMAEILADKSEDFRMLDVSILHSLILERLLGIDEENMKTQKNLTYTRSINEAKLAVNSGKADCAFFINPTAVEEIGAVAANGEKMPQKSTYFYPKLSTGFVMNNIRE